MKDMKDKKKKRKAEKKNCAETEAFVRDVAGDRNVEALRRLQRVLQRKVAKRITDTLNA